MVEVAAGHFVCAYVNVCTNLMQLSFQAAVH